MFNFGWVKFIVRFINFFCFFIFGVWGGSLVWESVGLKIWVLGV